MTPSCPHRATGVHRHRLVIRRTTAVLVAAFVIGGGPLVARAIGEDPVPAAALPQALRSEATAPPRTDPLALSIPTLADPPAERAPIGPSVRAPELAQATRLDVVTQLLTAGYAWDERSPRVEALQFVLGIPADGWYSAATLAAHRSALELAGLPVDRLPVRPIPDGPAPEQWAALRECESGGDYTITNASGKYRGAYQFDRPTWDSVAGRHDPSLVGVDPAAASPADQDAMAFALYLERGAGPWPHCGRHLR